MHWLGPICISKNANLDTAIGPVVEFTAGIHDQIEIFTEALQHWLWETWEASDAQQAEIPHCEWGTILGDGAVWVSQGGHARIHGLDQRVG